MLYRDARLLEIQIFYKIQKLPKNVRKSPQKSPGKKENLGKKLGGIVSIPRDFLYAEFASQNIVFKPATLNGRSHSWKKRNTRVCEYDIKSAIGVKFQDAFAIIYKAGSRIIYPTFQRFLRRF